MTQDVQSRSPRKHVLIIGGGTSGALFACHLLGDRTRNVTVTLIEKRQDAGRGIAYCTADPNHLLNVRAVNMSAFDPLGIGIDITPECAVVDRSGAPSERLFAIGPVTRAAFWEIVAVPDIRNQCAAYANRLGRALGR
jgi:uncharacterized NAD(P)/FAD-binding protein YdhS